jgi:hypothetical protein
VLVFDRVVTTDRGQLDRRRSAVVDRGRGRQIRDATMNPLPVRADEFLHGCRRCARRDHDLDPAARIYAH